MDPPYENGEIIYEDVPNVEKEIRHGFTIHSIQGETAEKKVIIDMSYQNDLRVLYTAISRAKEFSQIHIIDADESIIEEDLLDEEASNHGFIYKIECKDKNIKGLYIGSTNNFKQREEEHKKNYNNPQAKDYNNLKYKFIREHGGWVNMNFQVLEYH